MSLARFMFFSPLAASSHCLARVGRHAQLPDSRPCSTTGEPHTSFRPPPGGVVTHSHSTTTAEPWRTRDQQGLSPSDKESVSTASYHISIPVCFFLCIFFSFLFSSSQRRRVRQLLQNENIPLATGW